MNVAAAIDAFADDLASDEAGYDVLLRELAEIGMRIARRLDQVTEAVVNGEPEAMEKAAVLLAGKDVGAVLGRVSRGVRLTIMLAQRQAEADHRQAKASAEQQAAEDAQAETQRAAALKREVETALAELEDLLGGEFADIGDYYLTAGVEMVCQALGVAPDRSLWTNDMPGPHAFERASLKLDEDEDFDDWSP